MNLPAGELWPRISSFTTFRCWPCFLSLAGPFSHKNLGDVTDVEQRFCGYEKEGGVL